MADHLKMHTKNIADENFAKLATLFPNVVTETISGYDEHGKAIIERAIDKDILMQEINCKVVEGREERYQFTWPDKRKAILAANMPINKTLRPCRAESVNFDSTQNLYIEGDNLEVLKVLQETYLGKIKMIYIDPPYNTGNDFVYNDDFRVESGEWRAESGSYDESGNLLVDAYTRNTESNGRFHTDWLNMIYPRLKLARDLLSDDGLIFISIDDNEQANVKKICDEIFGEGNFYARINWIATNKAMNAGDAKYKIQDCNESIFIYGKQTMQIHAPFNLNFKEEKKYPYKNENGEPYRLEEVQQRKNIGIKRSEKMVFPILNTMPKTGYRWTIGENTARLLEVENNVILQNGKPIRKIYAFEEAENSFYPLWSDFSDTVGTSETGKAELFELLGKEHGFETVKPVDLLQKIVFHFSSQDSIILDFFSGSATTAHAVMQLNAEDGGRRKFIMVQLPEVCDEKSEAFKAGYKNICEIGKERIRRAGKKIAEEMSHGFDFANAKSSLDNNAEKSLDFSNPCDNSSNSKLVTSNYKLDTGFRVLKLDSSNMQDVYYSPEDWSNQNLFQDNIKADRSAEDLLFQVMLDLGIMLSSKIDAKQIDGKSVYYVADGYLVACFDENVGEETITKIAKEKPYYFVMRDSSMASDSVATNFEQIFATYSSETVCKVL